jgi:peptide-methionine (S)-S-oxide reductase
MAEEIATFAAGCFWGVEAEFRRLPGILETEVGYTGGHTEHPTYRDVCSGTTGHAESVRIRFDPDRIAYEELLEAFWQMHDPTTPDRQGPDIGTQYRSAIFYHSDEQRRAAIASRDHAQRRFSQPIVTEIVPAGSFWRAEEYHQRYLERRAR